MAISFATRCLVARVYILDFALDEDEMRRIKNEASEVRWYDHHKTNLEMQERLGWGTLDTSECGASLTWKMEYPDEPLPEVLQYVKDKDLWTWELPNSREITAGLFATYNDRNFTGLLDADLERMRRKGIPILRALDERVAKTVGHGVQVDEPYGLRNIKALVINAQIDHNDVGALANNLYPKAEKVWTWRSCFSFVPMAAGYMYCARQASTAAASPPTAVVVATQQQPATSPTPFPYSDDCLRLAWT